MKKKRVNGRPVKRGPVHFRNARGAVLAFCGKVLERGRYQPKWSTRFGGTTCKPCKARINRVWGKGTVPA